MFVVVIGLIFMFSLWCVAGLGAFVRAEFLCVAVLGVASGPGVELVSCKSALNPPPPPRWFALPTVLGRWSRCWSCSLLLCGVFCEAICCVSFRVSFCSCVFSVLLVLRLPRLGGGEDWSWCFSCVCSVCACLGLSVSSSSWDLGRAAVCGCGIPWTFLLPFFKVGDKVLLLLPTDSNKLVLQWKDPFEVVEVLNRMD